MILTPLQKLTENVGDLGKFIVAKCFELLPKVQKITQSGHTVPTSIFLFLFYIGAKTRLCLFVFVLFSKHLQI